MSANRKLQTEIQQVLKKLEEGLVVFDDIWEKVYAAAQQSLKEKYESDLKKEIKKLQRLRDQIKSWLGNPDVKDKAPLIEARKVIESKMEQFKVCEKDTKAKMPKDSLREYREDPKEAERDEKRSWLQESIERLENIMQTIHVEIEKVANSKGKSKNKEQLELLDNRLKKNQWHISKLEQILEKNDDLDFDPTRLDAIKDDVEFYIESAVEDDGALGIDDEFNIYEELQLDVEPEEIIEASKPLTEPTNLDDNIKIMSKEENESGKLTPKKPLTSTNIAIDKVTKLSTATSRPLVPPKVVTAPTKSIMQQIGNPVAPSPKPITIVQNDAIVPVDTVETPVIKSVIQNSSKDSKPTTSKSANESKKILKSPVVSNLVEGIDEVVKDSTNDSKRLQATSIVVADAKSVPIDFIKQTTNANVAIGVQSTSNETTKLNQLPSTNPLINSFDTQSPNVANPISTSLNDTYKINSSPMLDKSTMLPPSPSAITSSHVNLTSIPMTNYGNSASVSMATVSQKASVPALSPEAIAAASMLRYSMINSPENMDSEKSSSYSVRNLYQNSPPSYPNMPPSPQENNLLFERLPMDSLFFAFYYQPGTYAQYLAAKQLKKHSWRFHKKYMTWFQRHEEPKVSSDEYEEGTYVYFDYESGWCQRIKSEFKFEYAYLEE